MSKAEKLTKEEKEQLNKEATKRASKFIQDFNTPTLKY